MLDCREQVDQRTPEAVYRPHHHNIESPFAGIVQHPIDPWSFLAALCAANASIMITLDNLPPSTLRDGRQFLHLIVDTLFVRRYANIDGCAFSRHILLPRSELHGTSLYAESQCFWHRHKSCARMLVLQ